MTDTIYPLSQWSFNDKVSQIFDNHVRQSVPLYDSLQQLITQLSDFFIQPQSVVYDLGCSTGETVFLMNKRHKEKKVKFIGIDESNSMLKKAIEKNKDNENIQFVQKSIENYEFEYKSNLIVSILTIQFIPIEQRKRVLKLINESLNKGGAFLFVEKSYPEYSNVHDMYTQIYHDEKQQNGLSPLEIREKDKSLRGVLNPLSIKENEELLLKTGFTKIEIFFKYLNFTGFLAIK